MRLRRSDVRGPGIRRVRRGRGFSYEKPDDTSVTDAATLPEFGTWSSRPPGRRCGSARTRTVTSKRSEPTRPAAASTSTTRSGRRNATRRSSTGCWRCRRRCPTCDAASRRTFVAAGSNAIVCSRWPCICSTSATSGRAASSTPRRTTRSGSPRCCANTWRCSKEAVEFDYPAKSGVRRTLTIDDPEVVRSVRALLRRRGRTERLLVCRNSVGLGRHSRRRPQRAVQGTRRRRVHRQGPAHLARHRAGGRGVRRHGPSGEQDRDQTGGVRRDERGRRGARQHPRRGPLVVRRSAGGPGLRVGRHDRRRRAAGLAHQKARRTAGDPGEQHRAADPQGGQGLNGSSCRLVAAYRYRLLVEADGVRGDPVPLVAGEGSVASGATEAANSLGSRRATGT